MISCWDFLHKLKIWSQNWHSNFFFDFLQKTQKLFIQFKIWFDIKERRWPVLQLLFHTKFSQVPNFFPKINYIVLTAFGPYVRWWNKTNWFSEETMAFTKIFHGTKVVHLVKYFQKCNIKFLIGWIVFEAFSINQIELISWTFLLFLKYLKNYTSDKKFDEIVLKVFNKIYNIGPIKIICKCHRNLENFICFTLQVIWLCSA